MIAWVLLLLGTGLILSSFFSGHETGFYRVAKLRLAIRGLEGSRISRGILWIANRPSLFVATTLVGNNIANYLTSLSIVLAARLVVRSESAFAEIIGPILLTPVVFVYGELLPKYLFFSAPNALLHRSGILFLFFSIILAPLTVVLWGLGRLLELALGQSPNRAMHSLARTELRQVFEEGADAGVLQPAQRELAYNLVSVASQAVATHGKPIGRIPIVAIGSNVADAIRLVRRNRMMFLLVAEKQQRSPIGYVQAVDLYTQSEQQVANYRPLLRIPSRESIGSAMLKMQAEQERLACIVDEGDEPIEVVTVDQLVEPLLVGELSSLRR